MCRWSISSAHDAPRARPSTLGCKALLIPSRCPKGHSPSHIAFDPIWAMAQEAGLPILFHVGGEEKLNADYFENGLPRVKDFHGGEENFTSVSYMPIPHSVMTDAGRADLRRRARPLPAAEVRRHRTRRLVAAGLDAQHGFRGARPSSRTRSGCRSSPRSPSEIVRRQVRVTPYPHEDAGWIIANSRRGGLPVLVRLPACRGRAQSAQALQRQPGRHAAARSRPLLLRQFHRPDGRGPGARPAPARAARRRLR